MEIRMRRVIFAALLAATLATPAFAQDSAPFTGPRVEGIVGWDRPKVDDAGHDDGVTYGVGVGYDFQMGGAVVGVEAEASDSTTKECATEVAAVGDELCFKAKRDLYAGARAGAVIGERTLVYGKAGYTNARFGLDYDDGGTGAGNFEEGENLDGVRAGAGVEHAIGPNSYVKTEYRYSNYENGVSRHQVVGGVGFRF
jgi:outer membrane immunogenic protein